MNRLALSDWQVVEAVALRRRGWSFAALAALYGAKEATVRKAVDREKRSHRAAGKMVEVIK